MTTQYKLRYVAVQDAAWFIDHPAYQDHELWTIAPFCLPQYREWARGLKSRCENLQNPTPEMVINKLKLDAREDIADIVRSHAVQHRELRSDVRDMEARLLEKVEAVVIHRVDAAMERILDAKVDDMFVKLKAWLYSEVRPADQPVRTEATSAAAAATRSPGTGGTTASNAVSGETTQSDADRLSKTMYVNTLGDGDGAITLMYKGYLRFLTPTEINTLGTFTSFRDFVIWFGWGKGNNCLGCGGVPPPIAVIAASGRRTLNDERGSRSKNSNVHVILFYVILNSAAQYLSLIHI